MATVDFRKLINNEIIFFRNMNLNIVTSQMTYFKNLVQYFLFHKKSK